MIFIVIIIEKCHDLLTIIGNCQILGQKYEKFCWQLLEIVKFREMYEFSLWQLLEIVKFREMYDFGLLTIIGNCQI